jgi:hypothetical protein
MKYLRQLIQHIISESLDNSHSLAVSIKQGTYSTEATLYDTGTLQHILPTLSLEEERRIINYRDLAHNGTIKGFIEVGPPHPGHGNCNGAWEVKRSAGPGHGALIYGIAYALSPNGKLMSARDKVSFSAEGGWHKQLSKRNKQPLDDRLAHNPDGTSAKPHHNHTDDTADDCTTWPTRNVLNYTYDSLPNDWGSLEDLSGTHRATAGELEELTGISQDSLDSLLNGAGNWFFSRNYRG